MMDYKKAFDLIDHSLLITKFKNYGINPHIINWICDFLMDRRQGPVVQRWISANRGLKFNLLI
jgi:hypothetical protein